jgi:2-aminoadipate transaminase
MSSPDLPQGGAPNTIPLMLGHPDPATLLTPELRQAMEHVISSPHSYAALQYGPEQGTQNLIEVLVEKINREQELSLQPGNLMVVAGSTHAVDMLARLYGRPGGVVLVEAPTYADDLHIFRDHLCWLHGTSFKNQAHLSEINRSGLLAKTRKMSI